MTFLLNICIVHALLHTPASICEGASAGMHVFVSGLSGTCALDMSPSSTVGDLRAAAEAAHLGCGPLNHAGRLLFDESALLVVT